MSKDFYKTTEKVRSYISSAKDVNSQELIKKLREFLTEKSSLLELGSGPGTDYQLLSKIYQTTGSDFSEEFLTHLRKTNPNSDFLHLDASSLKCNKLFDGIYSNKVLHHLTDQELQSSIKSQGKSLKPNGIICHSFWKGEDTDDFDGMFVNYHMPAELKKMFEDKFEILLIEDYEEFELNDSILLIAKKKN